MQLDLAFTRSGGRIVDGRATGVEMRGGRPVGVQLADGGLIRCGQVVIAAGAQSLELLDGLDDLRRRIPPMVSGYGVSALFGTRDGSLPATVLRSPNRAFACGIHCIPRGDGVLYVGGTNVLTEQPRRYATVR